MTFFNGDKLDAEDVAWSINELIAKGYHDATRSPPSARWRPRTPTPR